MPPTSADYQPSSKSSCGFGLCAHRRLSRPNHLGTWTDSEHMCDWYYRWFGARGAGLLQPHTTHHIPYLLENWNRFLAPGRPGFLRSTARASRVSRPRSRSLRRYVSSIFTSARATARRSAPAWPVDPPPSRLARTSYRPSVSVAVNGCWMADTWDGRGK